MPSEFNGRVRLFPLPNLVMFPGVIQGLHIFESRYRRLMEETLRGDGLITMAMYRNPEPSEPIELGDPPIFSTVCIGKVITHAETDDGRFNLLLLGIRRARIIEEIASELPYRIAEVELIQDANDLSQEEKDHYRSKVVSIFRKISSLEDIPSDPVKSEMADSLPLGLMLDMMSFAVGAAPDQLISVLETYDIRERAEIVHGLLKRKYDELKKKVDRGFPPEFSLN